MASDTSETTRRDFIFIAAGAFPAIGGLFALWPLIDQMNPDSGAQALASVELEIGAVPEGQAITAMWRGKPVFIRHRTATEIEQAKGVPMDDLVDPEARNQMLPVDAPATDLNRVKDGKENWLVLVGICTHLGCIPKGQRLGDNRGDYGGWFCPCHGSHYDTAGRIRKGPAPRNLDVPPYEYVSDTRIRIG